MHYTGIFSAVKIENFIEEKAIFQNIDGCDSSNEYPQSAFKIK